MRFSTCFWACPSPIINAQESEGCQGRAEKDWRKNWNTFWDKARTNSPSPQDLEKYLGSYSNPLYGQVSVALKDKALNLTFDSGISLPLRNYSADTFATESGIIFFSHLKVNFESAETVKSSPSRCRWKTV